MNLPPLNTDIPVYVTREYGDEQSSFTVNLYVAVFIWILGVLNALGWGIYGLVSLIGVVL